MSDAAYTDAGTWTFFAVTKSFNGIEETLRFYKGGTGDSAVTLVTLGGSAAEPVRAGLPLQIGNRIDLVRPFDGLIDNVRIFAATSGTGGVLPLADLEFIRLADLANVPIPEPGGAACALAFVCVVLRRRRA